MRDRGLRFRVARPEDAQAVAALHADSWQRHYRGAYSDVFLDREAAGHLAHKWAERLARPLSTAHTIVAEDDGKVVGLAHTVLGEDPVLLDQSHASSLPTDTTRAPRGA
jgi:hypothetical protein